MPNVKTHSNSRVVAINEEGPESIEPVDYRPAPQRFELQLAKPGRR